MRYTLDASFARETLLPIATAVTTYYDQHWKRGADGKIRFDPAQSLETRQQAVNPTPDIAGLMSILPRLLALPASLTTDTQRAMWIRTLADLPPHAPWARPDAADKIPEDGKAAPDGKPIILPAEKYSQARQRREHRTVRRVSLSPLRRRPAGLELARNTYAAKAFQEQHLLGSRRPGRRRARAGRHRARPRPSPTSPPTAASVSSGSGKQGHDAEPDMDNGGAGMSILQLMLLQTVNGKTLMPSRPGRRIGTWISSFTRPATRRSAAPSATANYNA